MKEYFRCETCGNLIGDEMIRKGICAGHKIKETNRVSFGEWVLIKFGRIK